MPALNVKSRVLEWTATFGVKVHGLHVRPMRNIWASGFELAPEFLYAQAKTRASG